MPEDLAVPDGVSLFDIPLKIRWCFKHRDHGTSKLKHAHLVSFPNINILEFPDINFCVNIEKVCLKSWLNIQGHRPDIGRTHENNIHVSLSPVRKD